MEMEAMKRLITTMLLCAATVAHADFITGNKLMEYYREDHYFSKGFVMGYVAGVYDAGASITHCPPSTVTLGQVNDLARRHLEDNPAIRSEFASIILVRLFRQTWPCAKKGTGI